jgi:prepilin-type processing-associated H-X9-DG protein
MGMAFHMYAQGDDNEKFPQKFVDLFPDQVADKMIFHCKSVPGTGISYTYLTGLTANSPSSAIVAFDKAGNHDYQGRNVLYVDAHVKWLDESRFRHELGKMLQPQYKKHYSKEAVTTINKILAGKADVRPIAPAPKEEKSQFQEPTSANIERFLLTEGKKLGASIDFAIFPMVETFPGARKSNYSTAFVKEDGIYSQTFTGHVFTGAGDTSSMMVTVAVIAIIAAIAIPSLIRSRISANEACAAAGLKTYNGMMATFKMSDYDCNGVRDYPTSLCALYFEVNNNQEKVTLIGIADAKADYASNGTYTATYRDKNGQKQSIVQTYIPMSKAGYWYAMIPLMHDGKPYAENRRNHYALCAWPADYGASGQMT